MSEELYNIVFKGELVRSFDLQQAKSNLGRLFKLEGQKLDALFSGRTIILKKNVSFDVATNYRVAIKKAGARVDLVPVAQATPKVRGKAVFGERPAPGSEKTPTPPDQTEEANGGLTLAPAGAPLLQASERAAPAPVNVDTSALSLRSMEGDLLDDSEKHRASDVDVDLSDFDLAPVGDDLLQSHERKDNSPREIDTHDLTLADPGARLGQVLPPPPPAPDVSGISLESD